MRPRNWATAGCRRETRRTRNALFPKARSARRGQVARGWARAKLAAACPPAAGSAVPAVLPGWMKVCLLRLPGGSALALDSLMAAPRARDNRRRPAPAATTSAAAAAASSPEPNSRFRRGRHRGRGGARRRDGPFPRAPPPPDHRGPRVGGGSPGGGRWEQGSDPRLRRPWPGKAPPSGRDQGRPPGCLN